MDFKGSPLCGCKKSLKTTLLNKGFNKEKTPNILVEFNCLWLVWLAWLVLVTSPRIPTNPRPWNEVFTLEILEDCSQAQVFHPLPCLAGPVKLDVFHLAAPSPCGW